MPNYGKSVDRTEVFGGPARVLVQYRYDQADCTEIMDFFPTQFNDIMDMTTTEPEDAAGYWVDVGGTDGGTTLVVHEPLTEVRVDHERIGFDRQDADASISTTFGEQSFENLKLAFAEDATEALNPTPSPDEETWDVDLDDHIPMRQMALVVKKRNGRKRAYVFHTVQIEGGDISMPFTPGGGNAHIPVTFRALRRDDLAPKVFRVIDQLDTG